MTKLLRVVFMLLILSAMATCTAWCYHKSKIKKPYTVVIDAGHGGKDPGAIGKSGNYEKTVVLNIAIRVFDEINRKKGMRAILTRDGDYYVPLRGRLQLARRDAADVFISIHADAYVDAKASGISVYALSQHGASNEAARWLAQHENYPELGRIELNQLHDPNRELRSVLLDMSQTATIRDSLRLGNKLLDAFGRLSSLHYSRVERAPFLVLKSPDIPSVLIETGYISNPIEETLLSEPRYQAELAHAIALGIVQYAKN